MKKDYRIITNNPLVREKLGQDHDVEFYDCSYEDVLKKVKEEVCKGYKLLTLRFPEVLSRMKHLTNQ